MRYFLQAIESETQFSFEQEVSGEEEYANLKQSLESEGYEDFTLDERWSSLNEMYETLAEDELKAK